MNGLRWYCWLASILFAAIISGELRAQDTSDTEYFAIDVQQLTQDFDDSQIVSREAIPNNAWYQMESSPRIVVNQGCEAYLRRQTKPDGEVEKTMLVGMRPKGVAVRGNLYWLQRSHQHNQKSVMVRYQFAVPIEDTNPSTREDFLEAKGNHYQRWWSEGHAGSALWRHLATTSLSEIGQQAVNTGPNWPLTQQDGLDATIQLMSGGRAVSENLQIDRPLPIGDEGLAHDDRIELASVPGISIAEIDWKKRLGAAQVSLDPLATYVPHNQYAFFLPNFATAVQVIENGSEYATPLMQWLEPQSRAANTLGFYQAQIGLSLDFATRQLGNAIVNELAVTGSDPYFRTGTDVAILMSSEQSTILHGAISLQVSQYAKQLQDAARSEQTFQDALITGWKTPDRRFSSYLSTFDGMVVVSNSLHQIQQIILAGKNLRSRMMDLDEYKFFRLRYPRFVAGAKPVMKPTNKSLLVVTDAAIRRWCGPQWRIGASRRIRARAGIAELTAQHLDDLVTGKIAEARTIESPKHLAKIGEVTLAPSGVRSDQFGTLEFLTPIAELDLAIGSRAEVNLYEQWRLRYENRWRKAFDPIAIEIDIGENSISTDLTVIPLILGTDYRQLQDQIGSERLKHTVPPNYPELIVYSAIAIDTHGSLFDSLRDVIGGEAKAELFSWMDGEAIGFIDYEREWFDRLSQASPWQFDGNRPIRDFPAAVFVPSRDASQLTLFVSALRKTIERIVPNFIKWEEVEHPEVNYVVGKFLSGFFGDAADLPEVYYATLPKGFLISTNLNVFQRAIGRLATSELPVENDSRQNDIEQVGEVKLTPQHRMLVTGKGSDYLAWGGWNNGMRRMSRIAWTNIPVLNYLRNKYPDQDPFELYERIFGEELLEPAEGDYQWNENMETYESSHYGHHLAPKAGPSIAPVLLPSDKLETSLSFQDGGLRAELKLYRD